MCRIHVVNRGMAIGCVGRVRVEERWCRDVAIDGRVHLDEPSKILCTSTYAAGAGRCGVRLVEALHGKAAEDGQSLISRLSERIRTLPTASKNKSFDERRPWS